jgi:hypothetical protein
MGDYRVLSVDFGRKIMRIEGDIEACAADCPKRDGAQAFAIVAMLPPKYDGGADVLSHRKSSLEKRYAWIMPDAVIMLHDIP